MSSLTEILKKANIPAELAYEFESELDKKFVAREPFPPLKWEKEVLMPLQHEHIKSSERILSLRNETMVRFEAVEDKIDSVRTEMISEFEAVDYKIESLRTEMNSKFEAVDAKFHALQTAMNSKFDVVDNRFLALETTLNSKFKAVELNSKTLSQR